MFALDLAVAKRELRYAARAPVERDLVEGALVAARLDCRECRTGDRSGRAPLRVLPVGPMSDFTSGEAFWMSSPSFDPAGMSNHVST